MLILATIPVHETSLANQHFYSTLLGRREGVCKRVRSVRLLKMMDDPLEPIYNLFPFFTIKRLFNKQHFTVYRA